MHIVSVILFLITIDIRYCWTYNEIDEIEEYGDCKPLYTHNYGYKIFFNLPKSSKISNNSIYFEFSVKTSSDAHVLLSTTPFMKPTDTVYEIVVGAGWNTFTDIRRLYRQPHRTTNMTKNILNKNIVKKFWIKFEDGLISMGEGGINYPFIQWKDKNPISVEYVSFSSWHGTTAKWYFDCYGRNSTVVTNQTVGEKLRSTLFENYDPYSVPTSDDGQLTLNNNLYISYIYLDPVKSSMELRGAMDISWFDGRLKWDPHTYSNMELIKLTERNIWQPSLQILNDASLHLKWFDQGIVTVSYSGDVTWSTNVQWITRCIQDMSDWPNDVHKCDVFIGYSDQKSIILGDLQEITHENNGNAGLWQVLSVEGKGYYTLPPYEKLLDNETQGVDTSSEQGYETAMKIEITIRRYSTCFYYLINIPLRVTILISMITLHLSYKSGYRLILHVIVIIMSIINTLSIDAVLPQTLNRSAKILNLGTSVILVNIICFLVTAILAHLHKLKISMVIPQVLDSFVDYLTLRYDFFISTGEIKSLNLEEIEDDDSKRGEFNYKITDVQRNQILLLIIDYTLLISAAVTYIILLIIY